MVKHFYSFIIETDTLFLAIDSLSISSNEKAHLKSLAESHIHHSIIDSILSELAKEDKVLFVRHLNTKNHDKIWKFLRDRIKNVEEKIIDTSNEIKSKLYKDIDEVKSSS